MASFFAKQKFPRKYEDFLITTVRVSIAGIFVWFGALKVLGYNPVYDLIYHSIAPVLASGTGLMVLGLFEVAIGLLLFSNKAIKITHTLLFLHLLGTFSTFLFGWDVVFDPGFPVLSLGGEFVVKNAVIALSGLMILVHESKKAR
jgi:putative oxidoreductase